MADEREQAPDISPDGGPEPGDEEEVAVVATLELTLLENGRLQMGGEIPTEAVFYGMMEMAKEAHHHRKMVSILQQGPPGGGGGGGGIVRPGQEDIEQAERSKRE